MKKAFPDDDVRPKKFGVAMADVVQVVVTNTGLKIPPIVYDRKTGESVTKSDIMKARNYKTVHNTDYIIIVTEKGIKDNSLTEEREGILLVHPRIVVDIARRIRSFLIEISKQTQSNKGRQSKQAKLYGYFTSTEYYREIKETSEIKEKLDQLQKKEEDYHKNTWKRRKEFVTEWYEINKKNEEVVSDITQDDQMGNEGQDESKEDGDNPSS